MRKFNFRESQTLDFQFWDKYGAVSYTEILYMIQSNRVENASNASMPLYTTQSIFVYRGTQVYNLHIVHWAPFEHEMLNMGPLGSPASRGVW